MLGMPSERRFRMGLKPASLAAEANASPDISILSFRFVSLGLAPS